MRVIDGRLAVMVMGCCMGLACHTDDGGASNQPDAPADRSADVLADLSADLAMDRSAHDDGVGDDPARPAEDLTDGEDSEVATEEGVRYCAGECTAREECQLLSGPGHGPHNYACNGGRCAYLGCLEQADCGDGFVCQPTPTVPVCTPTCEETADCVGLGALPWEDEDNFTCFEGVCRYDGCRTDAECSPNVCRDGECRQPCNQPADCTADTSPQFDEDNYACNDGTCVYLGCHNDQECRDAHPSLVCTLLYP